MRKLFAVFLIAAILAGCSADLQTVTQMPAATQSSGTTAATTTPAPQAPTEPQATEPPVTEPPAVANPIDTEDTCWTAVSCYNEETRQYEDVTPESWSVDLTIRLDGTASFRDIHEKYTLTDDTLLDLSWEPTGEGTYAFYSKYRTDPVLLGTWENGVLSLDYMSIQLKLEQQPLPQAVGEVFVPAQLQGTWLMVHTEVEGYEEPAMPFSLASLVVRTTFTDSGLVLVADMQERNYYDEILYSAYGQEITVLDIPLYEGCGNETWSVQIASESDTEFYATLLDNDTLLLQRYYTFDGNPAVSYQTYRRFPEVVSWCEPESMELDYSNWVCTGYTNSQQEERATPTEMENFTVVLEPEGICLLTYSDGAQIQGTWELYNGGVLRMRGDGDEFWFGGTITYFCKVVDGESQGVYQMALYYDGGILRLALDSYG